MDVTTCSRCGKLFNHISGPRICPVCLKEFDDKFHKFSLVVQILQEWKQPVKFTHKKKQMYEKNYFKRSLQTVFGLSVALHP